MTRLLQRAAGKARRGDRHPAFHSVVSAGSVRRRPRASPGKSAGALADLGSGQMPAAKHAGSRYVNLRVPTWMSNTIRQRVGRRIRVVRAPPGYHRRWRTRDARPTPVASRLTVPHRPLRFPPLARFAGAKGVKGPATPSLSVGWRLRFFWSSSGKEFVGTVLDYNAQNKHHTVKWENGPDGRTGVTATNLKEGVVTLARQTTRTPHPRRDSVAGRDPAPRGIEQKKKKQKPASGSRRRMKNRPRINQRKRRLGRAARRRWRRWRSASAPDDQGHLLPGAQDLDPAGLLLWEIVAQTRRGFEGLDSVNQPSNVNVLLGDPALSRWRWARRPGVPRRGDRPGGAGLGRGEKVLYAACRGPLAPRACTCTSARCAFAKGNARGLVSRRRSRTRWLPPPRTSSVARAASAAAGKGEPRQRCSDDDTKSRRATRGRSRARSAAPARSEKGAAMPPAGGAKPQAAPCPRQRPARPGPEARSGVRSPAAVVRVSAGRRFAGCSAASAGLSARGAAVSALRWGSV